MYLPDIFFPQKMICRSHFLETHFLSYVHTPYQWLGGRATVKYPSVCLAIFWQYFSKNNSQRGTKEVSCLLCLGRGEFSNMSWMWLWKKFWWSLWWKWSFEVCTDETKVWIRVWFFHLVSHFIWRFVEGGRDERVLFPVHTKSIWQLFFSENTLSAGQTNSIFCSWFLYKQCWSKVSWRLLGEVLGVLGMREFGNRGSWWGCLDILIAQWGFGAEWSSLQTK